MKPERKLHLGNAIPRFIFVGISILLQLGWLLLTILVLNESVPWIGALMAFRSASERTVPFLEVKSGR